jgi:hypothetical protein
MSIIDSKIPFAISNSHGLFFALFMCELVTIAGKDAFRS